MIYDQNFRLHGGRSQGLPVDMIQFFQDQSQLAQCCHLAGHLMLTLKFSCTPTNCKEITRTVEEAVEAGLKSK